MNELVTGSASLPDTCAGSLAGFSRVDRALRELARGRPVVVLDDEDRENEGDLVFAAQNATPELVSFMVRHTSGYICVALPEDDCDRLDLPPMHHSNADSFGTAFTVTVDAASGITTGISAADRAHTIRVLADPGSTRADLVRPGHVLPLRAHKGGVLGRPGHTEAAVDLTRMAGLVPMGVLCEIVSEMNRTEMARGDELRIFADTHGLTLVTIADLIAYRRRFESQIRWVTEAEVPTGHGVFAAHGYTTSEGLDLIALVCGDLGDGEDVLVRLHSECLTGEAFGSLRCDCAPQLELALAAIAAEGRGVVLYLRGHEGRGIGLMQKLRAYQLQESGADTVDANLALGAPADARDYNAAAQVLLDLGLASVRLITNNPDKCAALLAHGLRIRGRVSQLIQPTEENLPYLRTKRDRMGHDLPHIDEPMPLHIVTEVARCVTRRATA